MHQVRHGGQRRAVAHAQVALERDRILRARFADDAVLVEERRGDLGDVLRVARDRDRAREVHLVVVRSVEVEHEAVVERIGVVLQPGAFVEDARGEGLPLLAAVEVAVDDQHVARLGERGLNAALDRVGRVGYGDVVVVGARGGFLAAQPPTEHRRIEDDAFALPALLAVAGARAVVGGRERLAGLHGGVEGHLDRRQRGQLQRQRAFGRVVGRGGGDVHLLVKQRIAFGEQVDVARRGVGFDLDVVVGQQHGVEVEQALCGREVERVGFARFIDLIDNRADFALGSFVNERVFPSSRRRSVVAAVVRARRPQKAAHSQYGEQQAPRIEFLHRADDL